MHRNLIRSTLALLALVGCKPEPTPEQLNGDPSSNISMQLSRYSSCTELESDIVDGWLEQLVQSRYSYAYYGAEDGVAEEAPSDNSDGDLGGDAGSPTDYSETNNQEVGVDEPDIVKTDGNFLYVVQWNGSVDIVKSFPADQTAKLSSIEVSGYPYSSFLQGDRLVVFSNIWDDGGVSPDILNSWWGGTRVTLIDVSDRSAPTIEREIDLAGYVSSARKIDSDAYLVMNSYTEMPSELWELAWSNDLPESNYQDSEQDLAEKRAIARSILRPQVEAAVATLGIEGILPKFSSHLPDEEGVAESLLNCSDIYHNDGIVHPGILSVIHLDLAEETPAPQATGLFADGWTVYASEDNLYVSQASWSWWWGYDDLDYQTHIHKFHLDGADTSYEASGAVDGWLLNSFSMGEHNGQLRVATTDIDWWWGNESSEADPANNVFVLDSNGEQLEVIGEVRGIAPNEQIYSARFVGDVGYLVTFRQIDPLFTLDLSNPTAPTIRGELELPGYSAYLHPVEDGYLLAVGMAGTEDGQITGLAVNLFDVSDLDHPTLADQILIESDDWSYSEALWDHHAFTFHRGVLSIPLYTYDWNEDSGDWAGFSGLLAVQVDTEAGALSEIGRISHDDIVADSECPWESDGGEVIIDDEDVEEGSDGSGGGGTSESEGADEPVDSDEAGNPCDYYWYASVRRSVAIEDNLYSISDYGIKVNETLNPSHEIARVVFNPADN